MVPLSLDSKVKIPLDLTFNKVRTVKKVEFTEAPDHRAVSDGLNIVCYCKNPECVITSEMFIANLGFGRFRLESIIQAA